MTITEFRAWLAGFVEAIGADPKPEHLEAIQRKAMTVVERLTHPYVSPMSPPLWSIGPQYANGLPNRLPKTYVGDPIYTPPTSDASQVRDLATGRSLGSAN